MDFDIAAEEMRRLKETPTDEEKLQLYGLYKQALHGDIPNEDLYRDEKAEAKYRAWERRRGMKQENAKEEYVKLAEEMIKKYSRSIVRSKWNSEVWSVDY